MVKGECLQKAFPKTPVKLAFFTAHRCSDSNCEADASRSHNNRSSKRILENLKDFLSIHALADFPEELELGFH